MTRAGVPPLGGGLGRNWNQAAKGETIEEWRVKLGVSKAFSLYERAFCGLSNILHGTSDGVLVASQDCKAAIEIPSHSFCIRSKIYTLSVTS